MASDMIKDLKTNSNDGQMDLVNWEFELKSKVLKNDYEGITRVQRFIEFMVIYVNNIDLKQQLSVSRRSFKLIKDIIQDNWRNLFIKDIIKIIFDIIIEESGDCWCLKKELLKIFNYWLIKTKKYVIHDAAKSISKMYLFKLVDSINSYGDYDLQVNIIETIFRTYGRTEINTRLEDLIPESAQLSQTFSEITPEKFDEDCRIFLNAVNEKSEKIFSIICASVIIDGTFCRKPMAGINGLWLDFNLCDNIISWYRADTSSDDIWELITLFSTELEEVSIESKPESFICISFKLSGQLISSEEDYQESLNQAKTVTIMVEHSDKAEELVKDVLPKVLGNLVYKTTPKSSQKCSTEKKYYKALNIKISKVANKSLLSPTKSDISSAYNVVHPLKLISKSSSTSNGQSTNNVDLIISEDQNNSIQLMAAKSTDSSDKYSKINNSQKDSYKYESAQPYSKVSTTQDISSSSDVWETAKQNLSTQENSKNGHNSSEISSLGNKMVTTNEKFDFPKQNKLTEKKTVIEKKTEIDNVYNKISKMKTQELKFNTGIKISQECEENIEEIIPKNSLQDNKVSKIQTKDELKSTASKCALEVNIEKIQERNDEKNKSITVLQEPKIGKNIEEIVPENSSQYNKVSKNSDNKVSKMIIKSSKNIPKLETGILKIEFDQKISSPSDEIEKTKSKYLLSKVSKISEVIIISDDEKENIENTIKPVKNKDIIPKKFQLNKTKEVLKFSQEEEIKIEKQLDHSNIAMAIKENDETNAMQKNVKNKSEAVILSDQLNVMKKGPKSKISQEVEMITEKQLDEEITSEKQSREKLIHSSIAIGIKENDKSNVMKKSVKNKSKEEMSDELNLTKKVSRYSQEKEISSEKESEEQLNYSSTAIGIKENDKSNVMKKSVKNKSKEESLSNEFNLMKKVSTFSQDKEIDVSNAMIKSLKNKSKEVILSDPSNLTKKASTFSQEEEILSEKESEEQLDQSNDELEEKNQNDRIMIEVILSDQLNLTKKASKFSQDEEISSEKESEEQLDHSNNEVEENNQNDRIMIEESKSKEVKQLNVTKNMSKFSQDKELTAKIAIKEIDEPKPMEKTSKIKSKENQLNVTKSVSKFSKVKKITKKQWDHLKTEEKNPNQATKENDEPETMEKSIKSKSKEIPLKITQKVSKFSQNKKITTENQLEEQLDHLNTEVKEDQNQADLIVTKEKDEPKKIVKSKSKVSKFSQEIEITTEKQLEEQLNHSNIEENDEPKSMEKTCEVAKKSKSASLIIVQEKLDHSTTEINKNDQNETHLISTEENDEPKSMEKTGEVAKKSKSASLIIVQEKLDHSTTEINKNDQNETHLISTEENDEPKSMEKTCEVAKKSKSASLIIVQEKLDHSTTEINKNDQNETHLISTEENDEPKSMEKTGEVAKKSKSASLIIVQEKLDHSTTEINENDQNETHLISTEENDEPKSMEKTGEVAKKSKSASLIDVQEELDHSTTEINENDQNEIHLITTKEKFNSFKKISKTNKDQVIDVDEEQQQRYPKRRRCLTNKMVKFTSENAHKQKDINKNEQQRKYLTRSASKITKEVKLSKSDSKITDLKLQNNDNDFITDLSKSPEITLNEQNEEPENYEKDLLIPIKEPKINEEPEKDVLITIEKLEINEEPQKDVLITIEEPEINKEPENYEITEINKQATIEEPKELEIEVLIIQPNELELSTSSEEEEIQCKLKNTKMIIQDTPENDVVVYDMLTQENTPKESKIISEENSFDISVDKMFKSESVVFSSPIDPDKAFDVLFKETMGNLNKVKEMNNEHQEKQLVIQEIQKNVQFDLKSTTTSNKTKDFNQTMSSGKKRRSRKLFKPDDLSTIIRDEIEIETEIKIKKNELKSINNKNTTIESSNKNISDMKKPKTKKTKRKNLNEIDLLEEQKLIDKKQKICIKNNIITSSNNSKNRGLSNLNFLQNSWRKSKISINFNSTSDSKVKTRTSKKRKICNSTPKKNNHINNVTVDISVIEKSKLSRKRNNEELVDNFIPRKRAKYNDNINKIHEVTQNEEINAEETSNRQNSNTNEIVQVGNNKILIHSNIRLNSFDPDPSSKSRKIQENEQILCTRLVDEESRECMTFNSNYGGFMGTMAPYWTVKALFEDKIVTLNSNDYIGKYLVIVFYPLDFATLPYANPPTEILSINEKYESFQELNTNVLGCSVDSIFTHDAWLKCHCNNEYNRSKENFKFPLLADTNHVMSKAFMIYSKTHGHSYRAYYIISPTGIIVGCSMTQINCPISIEEILIQIKCNQELYP